MARNTGLVSLEIVNFEQEIQRIEDEIVAQANLEIGKRIIYATEQLKIVTPVDTGEAREGWQFEIERSSFGKFKGGTILNNVEHIEYLNRGHSQQAPSYFIEQVLSTIGIPTA
jgi:hypothetical protein